MISEMAKEATLNFDLIIKFFAQHSLTGQENLHGIGMWILFIGGLFNLTTNWALYTGEMKIVHVLRAMMKIGVISTIISYWGNISKYMLEFFGNIGLVAGMGSTSADMFKPSTIFNQGFSAIANISKDYECLSLLTEPSKVIILSIAIVLTIVAYWYVAFQVMLINIEYYIISTFAVVLIPFGALPICSQWSQKAISAVINCGIKLMITLFMVGSIHAYLGKLQLSASGSAFNAIAEGMVMFTLGYLTFRLPDVTSGILNGQMNLDSGMSAAAGAAVGGAVGSTIGKMTPSNIVQTYGSAVGLAQSAKQAWSETSGKNGMHTLKTAGKMLQHHYANKMYNAQDSTKKNNTKNKNHIGPKGS